jgi:UDPglucose 6-dehydrogenase
VSTAARLSNGEPSRTKIAVVGGAGYVGLAYAVAFAALGHDVVGLDQDADRIWALRAGVAPIFEPGLEELLRRGLESGRLRFTTDYAQAIADAEFAFICVGTPTDSAGRAETKHIMAAARGIAEHGRDHTIVVNKSTMPIGSVEYVAGILAEHARPGATFTVVSNPEFLREGAAIHDIFHPDRIVLGGNDAAAVARVSALYAPLGAPVVVTTPRSAEMIKYASNAFLATKISFVNEVATICEGLGADVVEVAHGMGLDARIGPRHLGAGAGFGGSCFPKDVRALATMARDAGLNVTMLGAVLDVNAAMVVRLVDKLAARLGGLAGKRIAVLGLAFKPDTDDVREAPALAVIGRLLTAGATVRATDPVATRNAAAVLSGVEFAPDAYAAATGADAVVLMTEWSAYRTLNLDRLANAMRGTLVLDGRNALDPLVVANAGLAFEGIGRGALQPITPICDLSTSAMPAGIARTAVDVAAVAD